MRAMAYSNGPMDVSTRVASFRASSTELALFRMPIRPSNAASGETENALSGSRMKTQTYELCDLLLHNKNLRKK